MNVSVMRLEKSHADELANEVRRRKLACGYILRELAHILRDMSPEGRKARKMGKAYQEKLLV
jgi:hypothetical protein